MSPAANVYVIPLFVGSGTRIKAFEAMAMGRPVVSTTLGIEGLDVTDGEHFLRADNAADFAAASWRCWTMQLCARGSPMRHAAWWRRSSPGQRSPVSSRRSVCARWSVGAGRWPVPCRGLSGRLRPSAENRSCTYRPNVRPIAGALSSWQAQALHPRPGCLHRRCRYRCCVHRRCLHRQSREFRPRRHDD